MPQTARGSGRVHTRGVQCLIGVDIPDTRQDVLIEQRRLDRPARSIQTPPEHVGPDMQRVRPEAGPQRSGAFRGIGNPAEPTRVDEPQPHPRIKHPYDMRVRRMTNRIGQKKPPGHPELHDHGPAELIDNRQLFPVALEQLDRYAHRQAGGTGR